MIRPLINYLTLMGLCCLLCTPFVTSAFTGEKDIGESITVFKTPEKKFSLFKDKAIDIFPVPVVQSRPDEKESYGLMPVMLFSDKKTKAIETIIAAIGQYNSVKKFSGASIFYYYPHPVENPDEVVQFYFEMAQKYYREGSARYFNPHLKDRFYIDGGFMWLKTPYRRFYGYGSKTMETDESNFTSRGFYVNATFGYYLNKLVRVNFTENFVTTDLLTRAIEDVPDTLTLYGGLAGVSDTTNFIHKVSATYDSRPTGINSRNGHLGEAAFFFSHKDIGSDSNIAGFSLEGIHMNSMFEGKTVTVARVYVQDMYGQGIPFYLQSALGGDKEFRSYIPNRFVDTGKFLVTWEQRIRVLGKTIFGIPTEFWADPFVEIGSVFHHFNHIAESKVRTVGGLGLRFVVPPNVVGRIDIAIGDEGYNVYTALGYPF